MATWLMFAILLRVLSRFSGHRRCRFWSTSVKKFATLHRLKVGKMTWIGTDSTELQISWWYFSFLYFVNAIPSMFSASWQKLKKERKKKDFPRYAITRKTETDISLHFKQFHTFQQLPFKSHTAEPSANTKSNRNKNQTDPTQGLNSIKQDEFNLNIQKLG